MSVIAVVKDSWGWVGIDPIEIIAVNPFGNLLIRDSGAHVWRLCPEDLYCRIVAADAEELGKLLESPEFADDWEMRPLVRAAHDKLGPLEDGRRYCLKLPAPVGGAYDQDNLATLPLEELISFSGYLAGQINDLPDGAKVNLKVVG